MQEITPKTVRNHLSAFIKPNKFRVVSTFGKLTIIEKEQNNKLFYMAEVQSNLIKNIKKLQKLHLMSTIDVIFGAGNRVYAKFNLNEELISLRMLREASLMLSEAQIAALMSRIFEIKNALIQAGLIDMIISPELCFLDRKGRLIPLVVLFQDGEDLRTPSNFGLSMFGDVIRIFSELLGFPGLAEFLIEGRQLIELPRFSRTFKDFCRRLLELYEHPKIDFRPWNELLNHRLLKLKLIKETLKGVYKEFGLEVENIGELYTKKDKNVWIVPEEIKWRDLDSARKDKPGFLFANTSDSSGGSNSRESQRKDMFTPCFGGRESKSREDEEKSRLFVQSCAEVIDRYVESTKRESSSSFLVNALINLRETLEDCEMSEPNTTPVVLEMILSSMKAIKDTN